MNTHHIVIILFLVICLEDGIQGLQSLWSIQDQDPNLCKEKVLKTAQGQKSHSRVNGRVPETCPPCFQKVSKGALIPSMPWKMKCFWLVQKCFIFIIQPFMNSLLYVRLLAPLGLHFQKFIRNNKITQKMYFSLGWICTSLAHHWKIIQILLHYAKYAKLKFGRFSAPLPYCRSFLAQRYETILVTYWCSMML